MPFLRLIDSEDGMPAKGTAFGVGPEIHTHTVSDRDAARRILAYDLQQTADPTWAAEIMEAFDAGENSIVRLNGPDAAFTVEYIN